MSTKKSTSQLKTQIKELKKTSKGQAILKLIYWIIFFIVIIVFCLIVSLISPQKINENEKQTPPIEEQIKEEPEYILPSEALTLDTYLNAKNKLISKEYNYNYEIVIDNIKYIYNGTKNELMDTGYKESPTGTIKYYIDTTGTYQETTTEKTPIINLYENIDVTYLNLNFLDNLISTLEFKLNHTSDNYLYELSKDNINYQIELENTTYNLKFISIIGPNYNYKLTFN